ncbi:MAG TPA: cytochrome b/b6 domain-containing protein [Burkholderiales bacterium]|nr:cytochrome b/b6 domain-containing protein [Burkholderiales bacterium]
MRVWSPLVRFVHWSVAALVVIDLVNEAGANPWHRYLGYAAVALVIVRLVWGLGDTGYARLAVMAGSARRVLPYAKSLIARRAGVYIGHNPLGALMACMLWALILVVVTTGWAQQLDRFWGEAWLQDLHSAAAYVLAACVVIHVIGVLATSALHRVNLVKAMITGKKTPGGGATFDS